MQVVGGAVERIDDPDRVGLALDTAFLGVNRVIGIVLENAVDDGLFGRPICFTDVIVMALLLDLELLEVHHFL